MFVHTVLFWLKPEAPVAHRQQLLQDCRKILQAIPSVRWLKAGFPADTPRGVVDNSYDVGLTVFFENAEGHDTYQPHELHQQFLDRNQANWDRVVVYDFVDDRP